MIDRAGQQLGNYRLLRLLGHGGFAEVYLGEHIYLKTQAAIKVLQVQLGDDERNNFLNEARTIAHLVHPHIVRVLDFGVENETPFLVMDYAPNGTVRQHYPKGSRIPLTTIVSYVKQIAAALHYAHSQNIIHRDIKPGNMLLLSNEEVLLSDFGIALIAQSTNSQSTEDTVVGTIAYMAPEQIQGKPRPASDQYALGIVVYEWLCGNRPFQGSFAEVVTQQITAPPPTLRTQVPTISAELEEAVMVALAKDPKERFTSVLAFARALEEACTSNNQQQKPRKPVPHTPAQQLAAPHASQPAVTASQSSQTSPRRQQRTTAPAQQAIPIAPIVNAPPTTPKEQATEQGQFNGKHHLTNGPVRKTSKRRNSALHIVGMLLGILLLGGAILLTRHTTLLPAINLGFGISTLFLLSLLADVLLPFFGAILGAGGGLIVALFSCLVGTYSEPLFGYAPIPLNLRWYFTSIVIGVLAGLLGSRTLGRFKLVRAATIMLVDIVAAFGIGFGIPLSFSGANIALHIVAVLLGLILLPILLQIYKGIVGFRKPRAQTEVQLNRE